STIYIVISQGTKAKEVMMPNLIGLSEQEAGDALANAGLILGGIDRDFSVDYKKDTVMWQQYKKDAKLSEGQTVKIKISNGPEEKEREVPIAIDFSGAPDSTDESGTAIPFKLTVQFTDGDGSQSYLFNNAEQFKSNGSVNISVRGKGIGRVDVYFNGALNKTIHIDFNTGKVS
ncbi:MAG: PASTA domain-containing protein, partial [Clostridiales Family XIII bacterium]|nr:PASTA domain-containing protein [Clostridiales Family XIII bacterium]